MKIIFDKNAVQNQEVESTIQSFLKEIDTAEKAKKVPVFVYQDGVKNSYYIRCTLSAKTMSQVISLDARLDPQSGTTFRGNRELLLRHNTYLRMKADAEYGREFSDIIAEYDTSYIPDTPLKVWGGQHRSRAIIDVFAKKKVSRFHGFRVYFCLSKEQRTELALISNTSISVSNDIYDRQLEETFMGPYLRNWCTAVGLLKPDEDFPDVGSRAERITTQIARSFIVNFFMGKQTGEKLDASQLDNNIYEPYLCQSGFVLDEEYRKLTEEMGSTLWENEALMTAGKAFASLHAEQYEAISNSDSNYKSFRMKALVPSVSAAWSYVAGLLQSHPTRLQVHLTVPPLAKGAPDPLNADEMAKFRYYQDFDSGPGLGTRSTLKDRQRMAQVFLARTIAAEPTLDKKLVSSAVNQVTALKFFSKGYTTA